MFRGIIHVNIDAFLSECQQGECEEEMYLEHVNVVSVWCAIAIYIRF